MAHLELAGVRKVFGDHVAVESFDLRIEEGELVSFLGPSDRKSTRLNSSH